MKVYEYTDFVNCGRNIESFKSMILTAIKAAQTNGYQVDVQYGIQDGEHSALILGYKEQ